LMLLKIDTPFWKRNPYWFDSDTWGIIYAVHGFASMTMITLVMIHIYFALRPDEWWLTRSMVGGTVSREDYAGHCDTSRWRPEDRCGSRRLLKTIDKQDAAHGRRDDLCRSDRYDRGGL